MHFLQSYNLTWWSASAAILLECTSGQSQSPDPTPPVPEPTMRISDRIPDLRVIDKCLQVTQNASSSVDALDGEAALSVSLYSQ